VTVIGITAIVIEDKLIFDWRQAVVKASASARLNWEKRRGAVYIFLVAARPFASVNGDDYTSD